MKKNRENLLKSTYHRVLLPCQLTILPCDKTESDSYSYHQKNHIEHWITNWIFVVGFVLIASLTFCARAYGGTYPSHYADLSFDGDFLFF